MYGRRVARRVIRKPAYKKRGTARYRRKPVKKVYRRRYYTGRRK